MLGISVEYKVLMARQHELSCSSMKNSRTMIQERLHIMGKKRCKMHKTEEQGLKSGKTGRNSPKWTDDCKVRKHKVWE